MIPRQAYAAIAGAGLLSLAACSGAPDAGGNGRDIACGPLGTAPDLVCRLEVTDDKGNLTLTLRKPDGGFRKLLWPKGGMLAAADGAERLDAARLPGGGVEARIGGWAYRIERKGGGLP